MRWSPLVSLFALLAVTSIIDVVFAAPLGVILENRAIASKQKNGHKKLTAAFLKKSNYRRTALLGPTFSYIHGKITQTKTPKAPPKDKDADHILEAQTVVKAFHRSGFETRGSLSPAVVHLTKHILNDENNLAFVGAEINRAKGRMFRSALSGRVPRVDKKAESYMMKIGKTASEQAKKIERGLERLGIKGVKIHKEHKDAVKRMGFKRELSLEELA